MDLDSDSDRHECQKGKRASVHAQTRSRLGRCTICFITFMLPYIAYRTSADSL